MNISIPGPKCREHWDKLRAGLKDVVTEKKKGGIGIPSLVEEFCGQQKTVGRVSCQLLGANLCVGCLGSWGEARDNGVLTAAEATSARVEPLPRAAPGSEVLCRLVVVHIPAVYLAAHKVLALGYVNKEIFLVHVCHLYFLLHAFSL